MPHILIAGAIDGVMLKLLRKLIPYNPTLKMRPMEI